MIIIKENINIILNKEECLDIFQILKKYGDLFFHFTRIQLIYI